MVTPRPAREGRLVEDQPDAREGALERRLVAHVALLQLDVGAELGQVFRLARREIVEHAHLVPAGHERARDRRSNEAGSTRHETRGRHKRKTYSNAASL